MDCFNGDENRQKKESHVDSGPETDIGGRPKQQQETGWLKLDSGILKVSRLLAKQNKEQHATFVYIFAGTTTASTGRRRVHNS